MDIPCKHFIPFGPVECKVWENTKCLKSSSCPRYEANDSMSKEEVEFIAEKISELPSDMSAIEMTDAIAPFYAKRFHKDRKGFQLLPQKIPCMFFRSGNCKKDYPECDRGAGCKDYQPVPYITSKISDILDNVAQRVSNASKEEQAKIYKHLVDELMSKYPEFTEAIMNDTTYWSDI